MDETKSYRSVDSDNATMPATPESLRSVGLTGNETADLATGDPPVPPPPALPLPPPDDPPEPGDTVDGYVVDRLIGKGGMGMVFQVRDPLTGKEAALKTLMLTADMPAEEREMHLSRFTNEAQIMWQLFDNRVDHVPHIFHMPKKPLGIIMELLSQTTIEDFLEKKRFTEPLSSRRERLIPLMAKVARTLAQAHKMGIIHRDLKPANIIIQHGADDPEAPLVPVVVDFGIAKNPDRELTESQSLMGTPSYMSPEQLQGRTAQVDGRCDIFSLGMVLYRILTGEDLYEGVINRSAPFFERIMAQVSLLEALERGEGDGVTRLDKLPPPERKVVARCIAFAPEGRYETADQLAKALDRLTDTVAEGAQTVADPPPPSDSPPAPPGATPPLSERGFPKGLLLASAAAAAIASVVAILAMTGAFSSKPRKGDGGASDDTTAGKGIKAGAGAQKGTGTSPGGAPQTCRGSLTDRVACLTSTATKGAGVGELVDLLERGCRPTKQGVLPALTERDCFALAFATVKVLAAQCPAGADAQATCVTKGLLKISPHARYFSELALNLSYCHHKASPKASRGTCLALERSIGMARGALFEAHRATLEGLCLSQDKAKYTKSPGLFFACILPLIKPYTKSPELYYALRRGNYGRYCKTHNRYKRADKRVCAYERKNLSRLQNALSTAREKAVAAARP